MAAWSRKTLKKIRFIWRFLEKRPPYGKMCNILFRKNSSRHVRIHVLCVHFVKLPYRKSVKSYAICLTIKNKTKFRLAVSLLLLRESRSKPVRASLQQTMYSECPKFHANRFTSGGVIAERENTVKTHHKVNPTLGWSYSFKTSNDNLYFNCADDNGTSKVKLRWLPIDAMLARYVLWPCVSVSVCHKSAFY